VEDVLYRPRVLAAIEQYDRYRAAHGYEAIGDEIYDAIEAALVQLQGWEEIVAPTFHVRGEAVPVKRLLVTVRSKTFKAYVLPGPTPKVVGVSHLLHPGQRPIER